MKNFGLIYRYEIKKIAKRKLSIVFFFIILVITLLFNLNSLFEYTVGHRGEHLTIPNEYGTHGSRTDYGAFFRGIEIRYVDDLGNVVKKVVGPFQYLKMKREYAMKWSGKTLDDALINDMKDFVEKYNETDEYGWSNGWSFQNYYWVYQMVRCSGLNPISDYTTQQTVQEEMEKQWEILYEYEQLTPEELKYWNNHEKVEFPLTIAYLPAYQEIINKARWIHILLVFFVIFVLCDTCSVDQSKRVRQIVQTTSKGMGNTIVARLCAGITVGIGAGLILYLLTIIIQFIIFGTDGFHSPIQLIFGLVWSRLTVSCGEAVLIVCGTSLLLIAVVAACTMLCSELFQNAIAAMAIPSIFLVFTLLMDVGFFSGNRLMGQLWWYFPLQRINLNLLYDERLVLFLGKYVETIPFSWGIYFSIFLIALLLCGGVTYMRRVDRR